MVAVEVGENTVLPHGDPLAAQVVSGDNASTEVLLSTTEFYDYIPNI